MGLPVRLSLFSSLDVLILLYLVWIFYVIRKEMHHFLVTRQQHLIERTHAKSVQANTILITGIPKPYLSQEALYKLFNAFPGGVKKIWINRFVLSQSLRLSFFI